MRLAIYLMTGERKVSVMVKNLQLVVFGIGKEHYGGSIDAVQEIVQVPVTCPISVYHTQSRV